MLEWDRFRSRKGVTWLLVARPTLHANARVHEEGGTWVGTILVADVLIFQSLRCCGCTAMDVIAPGGVPHGEPIDEVAETRYVRSRLMRSTHSQQSRPATSALCISLFSTLLVYLVCSGAKLRCNCCATLQRRCCCSKYVNTTPLPPPANHLCRPMCCCSGGRHRPCKAHRQSNIVSPLPLTPSLLLLLYPPEEQSLRQQ